MREVPLAARPDLAADPLAQLLPVDEELSARGQHPVAWLQAGALLVKVPLSVWFVFGGAGLALAGHVNLGMAAAVGFENFASGIGGVTVVAYLSALCDLRFTAADGATELAYEIDNRPDWIAVPLAALEEIAATPARFRV